MKRRLCTVCGCRVQNHNPKVMVCSFCNRSSMRNQDDRMREENDLRDDFESQSAYRQSKKMPE